MKLFIMSHTTKNKQSIKISLEKYSSSSNNSSSNDSDSDGQIYSQNINNEFIHKHYFDIDIIVNKNTGYINATQLCKQVNKSFRHWKETSKSEKFIKEISLQTGIKSHELFHTISGGKIIELRGTYVHPLLITHIACWCGPNFSAKVSKWIEEWKKNSLKNEIRYWKAVSNITPSNNSTTEKQIQRKLHKKLGGEMEVDTTFGRIDLLTDDAVIEIKKYDDWKCAVGQVIMYSSDYPDRERIIYLFDVPDDNILDVIKTKCKNENIKVKKINY